MAGNSKARLPEISHKIPEPSWGKKMKIKTKVSSGNVLDVVAAHMLEEEVRRLREARLCKVCLDEEVSMAYIPCGHIVTCVQCAVALEDCPLCRKTIKGTVRIFFS